jgi:peptidylprolyl isomerase
LIQGFEDALMGMVEKDKKTFTLRPEEAYGERDETLKRSFDRSEVPRGFDPEVGQTVALHTPQGQQIPAKIVSVDEKKVTVDLNHPLAGKSLTFEIEVVGISDTPTQTPSCGSGCDCSSGCSC